MMSLIRVEAFEEWVADLRAEVEQLKQERDLLRVVLEQTREEVKVLLDRPANGWMRGEDVGLLAEGVSVLVRTKTREAYREGGVWYDSVTDEPIGDVVAWRGF